MVNFTNLFLDLQNNGVYEFILPFLLIFVILFAILEKTRILGQDRRNINFVFALIVSLIVILDPNLNVKYVMLQYLPGISLVIVVAVMFMVVAAMFSEDGVKGFGFTTAAIIALVVVFWSLADPQYGAGMEFIHYYFPFATLNTLITIAFLAIIGFLIFKGGNKETSKERAAKKLFGGG